MGIQKPAQHGEQPGKPLGLVDDQPRVLGEEKERVPFDPRMVYRVLQVRVGEAGEGLAGQGGLADLARPEDHQGGKPADQRHHLRAAMRGRSML